ncbi:MAG: hypothetical protein H0W50_01565 [Parachlamydiaceae bacterium]|nr:hypothetical protein [Parachlamydiaceae bacterium]
MKLYEPQSIDELLQLLEERKSHSIFRGQCPQDRLLNSTLARELRGETKRLPGKYVLKEPSLKYWTPGILHQYHKIILRTIEPHENVNKCLDGKGDPVFEAIRYVQQNPTQERIENPIPNLPTPTLEFSESTMIALYFSTYKPECNGEVFCLKKSSVSSFLSFSAAMKAMKSSNEITPCIIDPPHKLNDIGDLKPKRQKAVYIFQRDLRYPVDKYLSLEKIIIKQSLNSEIRSFLQKQGINEEYVYDQH